MKRGLERCFVALLLLGLVAVPIGVVRWSRYETTAYYENRALAEFPALTWDALWDGSFGADAESWYSDHMPGRTTLLKGATQAQLGILGRVNVNGIVDAGSVLLPYQDYPTGAERDWAAEAETMTTRYEHLHQHIVENGGSFYFVGLPEQRVYFEDRFPEMLCSNAEKTAQADAIFLEKLTEKGIRVLDMRAWFEEIGKPDALYSKVDHHYTYYGAYAAYRAILDALNADGWDLPVLTEEELRFEPLPNPYIGSRNRKLYNLWPGAEQPVIGVQKNPIPYTRTDHGERTNRPLFVIPEDPAMPTTYNLYMGGDFGETVMETNRPELPKALIVGDSFTNALETLLYTAFDETRSLDLRHYQEKSLGEYISDYQPDIVICVSNDTFYYTPTGNGAVWPD